MGILGVQCRVWALSSTILRFLTDYDGRALPTGVRQHGVSNQSVLHLAFKKMEKRSSSVCSGYRTVPHQ
jgi:hypothetical protein